jgi:hypothetical protein
VHSFLKQKVNRAQVALLLSENQFDWRVRQIETVTELIRQETFIGKMDLVGSVHKKHECGGLCIALGRIKKLELTPAYTRWWMDLDHFTNSFIDL